MYFCKFYLLFFLSTTVLLGSIEYPLVNDIILKIVAMPDCEKLNAIIDSKRRNNNQLINDKSDFVKIGKALFLGYAFLLTCKYYYAKRIFLKDAVVNALYPCFLPGLPIFLFPGKMILRIKNRYYPDMSREMIRAIYNDSLLNNPMLIQKYLGNMNGNTILMYKFLPRSEMFTVLERIIKSLNSFMRAHNRAAIYNCIAILDYLCLLKETRLDVAGVNTGTKNLAQYLFDALNNSEYKDAFENFFSEQGKEKINQNRILSINEYPEEMLLQNKPIITDLVSIYLPPEKNKN